MLDKFVYIIFGLSILSAIGVVAFRNLFYSALSLVAALFLAAVLYICLQAEFIAIVQILVYIGAVMTLIIFAIMLTARINDKTIRASNQQRVVSLIALVVFGVFLVGQICKAQWPQVTGVNAMVPIGRLGELLVGHFVLPFEAISAILTVALIGAIVIARNK